MLITLYHLDRSRSERIIWLMEELGLPYEVVLFRRQPDLYGPPEMKEVHALGRAPIIRDGDVLLAESGAIVQYILARYGDGRLAPAASAPNFGRYLYWLHYAEGSLMLQLLREWSLINMLPEPATHPGMVRVRNGTRQHLGSVDAALTEAPYFAGEAFTAADVMMAYPFTTFRAIYNFDLAPYPAIIRYVERLEARPAFQIATRPAAG